MGVYIPNIGVGIVTIILIIAIMLISANTYKPQLDNPQMIVREAPLAKVSQLKISPGESYRYAYSVGNVSVNLSYSVMAGSGCTIVALDDGTGSLCLDASGNDREGQNSSYASPEVILVKPWMLAVDEGWKWNVSTYMAFDGWEKQTSGNNFTLMRKEMYNGREAYVVRIASEEGEVWDWIDAEKRILLRELSPDYEVVLVSGLGTNYSDAD